MKKFSIGLAAIILAISAVAFTEVRKPAKASTFYNNYRYNGTTNAGMKDPVNYTWTDELTGCSDFEEEVVCIISSPGPSGLDEHPVFEEGTDPFDNEEDVDVLATKPLP